MTGKTVISWATLAVVWICAIATTVQADDSVGRVDVPMAGAVQSGRVAYIDPSLGRIVEAAIDGRKTWEFSIPAELTGAGDMNKAADIEWLAETDSFLFVVPLHGVFEVGRDKKIVWAYRSKHISHDADRLPNGNTIFVNGWDKAEDPTVTEVDRSGKVVFQWWARDHLDASQRRSQNESAYSFSHANSVRRLGDGSTLVSLRNFWRFVIIRDGRVVREVRRANWVHDPVPVGDAYLFAMRRRDHQGIIRVGSDGSRTQVFRDETGDWHPLRTVEILRNGNILITGSRYIGQIDRAGKIVWSLRLDGFVNRDERRGRRGGRNLPSLYKATWVYR